MVLWGRGVWVKWLSSAWEVALCMLALGSPAVQHPPSQQSIQTKAHELQILVTALTF